MIVEAKVVEFKDFLIQVCKIQGLLTFILLSPRFVESHVVEVKDIESKFC